MAEEVRTPIFHNLAWTELHGHRKPPAVTFFAFIIIHSISINISQHKTWLRTITVPNKLARIWTVVPAKGLDACSEGEQVNPMLR